MSTASELGDALLIVDPQIDFCPGGALPVPGGDRIFEPLNRVAATFENVVVSRDWHPPDHISFAGRGGDWPPHCVAGTEGAAFHPALDQTRVSHVVSKAQGRDEEAYSAFAGTGLTGWLRAHGVKRLVVGGLATDYCVMQSVLDARREGFEVIVLSDCIGAVDVHAGDGDRALAEMQAAGAVVESSRELARG